MKYCPHCGAALDDDARFCPECGQSTDTDSAQETLAASGTSAQSGGSAAQTAGNRSRTLIIVLAASLAVCLVFILYLYFSGSRSTDTGAVTASSDSAAQEQTTAADSSSGTSSNTSSASTSAAAADGYYIESSTLVPPGANQVLGFSGVSASSVHSQMNDCVYYPENVTDSDLRTAWVEGAAGSGVGESITIQYNGTESFENYGVQIYDGYCKSDQVFNSNSTPTRLKMLVNGTAVHEIGLSVTMENQYVNYTDPITINPGDQITFEIMEVYVPADDQNLDTAITDIAFSR